MGGISLSGMLLLVILAIFVDNFVYSKFLGCDPFFEVSKSPLSALCLGGVLTAVMVLVNAVTYCLYYFILVPFGLEYLKTISFVLITISLIKVIEFILKRKVSAVYKSLGSYLPIISTSYAVLGTSLLSVQNGYNFIYSVLFAFASGVGFTLAMLIFVGVKERLKFSNPPKSFKGSPIVFIAAGLIAMAFMGFLGINLG